MCLDTFIRLRQNYISKPQPHFIINFQDLKCLITPTHKLKNSKT